MKRVSARRMYTKINGEFMIFLRNGRIEKGREMLLLIKRRHTLAYISYPNLTVSGEIIARHLSDSSLGK